MTQLLPSDTDRAALQQLAMDTTQRCGLLTSFLRRGEAQNPEERQNKRARLAPPVPAQVPWPQFLQAPEVACPVMPVTNALCSSSSAAPAVITIPAAERLSYLSRVAHLQPAPLSPIDSEPPTPPPTQS